MMPQIQAQLLFYGIEVCHLVLKAPHPDAYNSIKYFHRVWRVRRCEEYCNHMMSHLRCFTDCFATYVKTRGVPFPATHDALLSRENRDHLITIEQRKEEYRRLHEKVSSSVIYDEYHTSGDDTREYMDTSTVIRECDLL
jgi:hypothetical protein